MRHHATLALALPFVQAMALMVVSMVVLPEPATAVPVWLATGPDPYAGAGAWQTGAGTAPARSIAVARQTITSLQPAPRPAEPSLGALLLVGAAMMLAAAPRRRGRPSPWLARRLR